MENLKELVLWKVRNLNGWWINMLDSGNLELLSLKTN